MSPVRISQHMRIRIINGSMCLQDFAILFNMVQVCVNLQFADLKTKKSTKIKVQTRGTCSRRDPGRKMSHLFFFVIVISL